MISLLRSDEGSQNKFHVLTLSSDETKVMGLNFCFIVKQDNVAHSPKVNEFVVVMIRIRACDTHAHLTCLAIKPHVLVDVFLARHVLLDLELVDRMIDSDLELLMCVHARTTHHLLTLHTLAGRLALPLIHKLANVARGRQFGWGRQREATYALLREKQLVEAANEKVVVEFAHASRRYDRLLATNGTRELAVVCVFVRALSAWLKMTKWILKMTYLYWTKNMRDTLDMTLNAFFAKRVQTRKWLGIFEMLEAYLARKKFVVYLLGQLHISCIYLWRCHCHCKRLISFEFTKKKWESLDRFKMRAPPFLRA